MNAGNTINLEKKDRLFNAFEQFNHSKNHNFGLGIGLSIVKGYSNILGGRIDYICDNNETTFTLKFPFEKIFKSKPDAAHFYPIN